jgi:hypothetical protein
VCCLKTLLILSVTNKLMCMKHTGMSRSEKLLCSPQIPHVLDWEALGALTKYNVTCETGGPQWGDYEEYSVEGRDDILFCGH